MSEEATQRFWRANNPILWGFLFTLGLAAIVLVLTTQIGSDDLFRYQEFSKLPSNAVGDTLAGIFAPLAFIWIVVTVFLQGQELSEQRKELSLTREELRLAREAQEKQLAVMEAQASIFEDEKLRRDQEEEKRTFDLKLQYLARDLLPLAGTLSHVEESSSLFDQQKNYRPVNIATSPSDSSNIDIVVRHFADQINGEAALLMKAPSSLRKIVALDGISNEGLQIIRRRAESVMEGESKLSERERLRFDEIRLSELSQGLAYLCDRNDLWDWERSGRTWVFSP